MNELPKRTKSQKIGQSAADLFSAVFTEFCNVIPVPQERDLGIDFICELIHGEYPTGMSFNVQCKGKEEITLQGDKIQVQIKVPTLNYWLIQDKPTFIIVVDCQNNIFYWSFPEEFLDSIEDTEWKNNEKISIPVLRNNILNNDMKELPIELISKIATYTPNKIKYGENFNVLAPIIDNSPSKENMTIKQLMRYYLEGSRIANVESIYGIPGNKLTVYPETLDKKKFSKQLEARLWGKCTKVEPGILLQLRGENNYVISYETFREICFLLSDDFSENEVFKVHTRHGSYPGGEICVKYQNNYYTATAWYEMPPGNLKMFKVNSQWYAISLVAPKTISTRRFERKSGKYLNPEPLIAWHNFNLSGQDYLLPLKY